MVEGNVNSNSARAAPIKMVRWNLLECKLEPTARQDQLSTLHSCPQIAIPLKERLIGWWISEETHVSPWLFSTIQPRNST